MADLSLEQASADTFEPHQDRDFMVDLDGNGDGGELSLRLTEVMLLASQPHAPRVEPLSLLFVGPATPILPQRIYRLAHPVIGS